MKADAGNSVKEGIRLIFWAVSRGLHLLFSFGGCCRFEPTCSVYCGEAVIKKGFLVGGWLGIKRLLSCHSFGPHGFDSIV
ncbi:MAG: membrane protein insertion efficiency factor YidD [Bdellovibrionales bacterium]|nr:membrane protein insertion efficiency factor YidD [Bdellovibrionales bacterium]